MKFEEIDGRIALVFDEMPALLFVSEDGVSSRLLLGGNEIPTFGRLTVTSNFSGTGRDFRGSPIEVTLSEPLRVPIKTIGGVGDGA